MTARITNRPTTPAPSTTSAPKPAAAPAPAAAQPAAKGYATTGASTFDTNRSTGIKDNSIGIKDNSIGIKDNSIGIKDNSIGIKDNSIGLKDHSIGIKDTSIGANDAGRGIKDHSIGSGDGGIGIKDHSIGIKDHSIGADSALPAMGPARDAYEKQIHASLVKYLEWPSYLRDNPPPAAVQAQAVKDHVSADPNFKALPAAQQQEFWTTFNAANTKGKVSLGALLEGTPQMFTDKDSTGHTLLDNLAQVATQKLHPSIPVTNGVLLDQLTTTLANPDEIRQGSAPTCTVTSMQYELVRDNPSEYARLVAGLSSTSGQAQMAGGGMLQFNPGSASHGAIDGRDTSQAIFQSAGMDYANGGARYDPITGENVNSSGPNNQGLSPEQQTSMLTQLFNITYQTDELPDLASRKAELADLQNYVAVGRNRPVLMEIDQGSFNHSVTFEMLKDNKIFFRDPYGTLRSMTTDAFLAHIVAVHKPVEMGT